MNQKINLDFHILETGSPRIISIYDNSDWSYSEDLPSYLSIIIPGSKKEINFSFKKGAINTLNSHNLGLSCLKGNCQEEEYVDLPDGIYTITLKSGFEDIESTKFYLKTDRFFIEYSKVLIKYGFEYDKNQDFINYMTRIKFLVDDIARAHAKEGDFVKAQRYFEEAKQLLKNYVNNLM
jgi:hypothetical protein